MFKNISTQDSQPKHGNQFIEPRDRKQGFAAESQEGINTSQMDTHRKIIGPDLVARLRSCLQVNLDPIEA